MKKVLVVDDDPDVLETLSSILTNRGFQVKTVLSAENIIDNIITFEPGVILLDVNINGTDGRKICLNLKSRDTINKIPVILFSGDQSICQNFKECKADAYISKPVKINNLVTQLNEFCVRKPL